jgi:hypothetical protein
VSLSDLSAALSTYWGSIQIWGQHSPSATIHPSLVHHPAGGVFLSAHRLYLQERVVPPLQVPSTANISAGKVSWLPHVGLQGNGDELALGQSMIHSIRFDVLDQAVAQPD